MEILLILIGFVLLIKASDYFVEAAIKIAEFFNVSEVVIGATIVSIGTTLPETMVSATSAFKGHGDISYGNALGSIICNTALIAATSLVFAPSVINKKSLKTPIIFFFSSFTIYVIFAYFFNGFNRIAGIVLVSIFIIYVFCIIKSNMNKTDTNVSNNEETSNATNTIGNHESKNKVVINSIIILIISAAIIAFASNLLVDNGTSLARKFKVPEAVIGLTLIAFGTSLPEFSTAITSIIKGHNNLSIGNIIGANFFNIVLVSGIAAIVGPFKLPMDRTINGINSSFVVDIPVAIIVMLVLCVPTLISGKTKRWQGILLYLIYAVFLIYQFRFN